MWLMKTLLTSGCTNQRGAGHPDDAEDAIEAQAVAAKADYYVITMIDETIITGQWYAQGILYRK
ncbi:DUF1471 domain-containing protein [Enterobacter hormaechei]|nr:DUF1471 domain-containing protein [Enterobacter hormaechei]